MITEVELVDFLSHRDTSVAFGPGMNVIVGPNGAGKSSIVDAITFALFGRHTRRVNRSIVRHGAPSGLARVTFESSGRTLRATRKIKGGVATPILEEASGEAWENIAAGERRQMGESTTREIESAVGMNFERMQIASIIRQGELSRIIHESPKDFKTRINDIAGISDMDVAEGQMADLLAGFRAGIRERHGHDDTHLPSVRSALAEARAGAEGAEGDIRRLGAERDGARAVVIVAPREWAEG
ncbi:MAG: SMC family ATPase, partial [Thaumarchaeota archaeon S14]